MELQYSLETARRESSASSGTIPWCFNEPYPSANGQGAVNYYGNPTPAYYAVKRVYAPFHVTAALPSFAWDGESTFTADLWLHNSGAEKSLLNVVAVITDLNGRELYQENLAAEAPETAAEAVGDLSWRFPSGFASPFILWLEVIDEEGETIARNAYLHSRAPGPPFAALLSLPETTLEVERADDAVIIKNVGPVVAVAVEIAGEGLLIEDSGFHLCPDTERRVKIDGDGAVTVSAWNSASDAPEVG
jgi:beta-mannosidase